MDIYLILGFIFAITTIVLMVVDGTNAFGSVVILGMISIALLANSYRHQYIKQHTIHHHIPTESRSA